MASVAAPVDRGSTAARVRRVVGKPQFRFGLLVLGPVLIWYAVFALWPIAQAFYIAVVDYQLASDTRPAFVGVQNFVDMVGYDLFWISLIHSVEYAVGLFVVMLPLALVISACLVSGVRGRSFYQFVVFLPVVVSLVAISLLFKELMDGQVGLFNYILEDLGLPPSQFLAGEDTALASVIGVDVWKSTGFYVVIITAGMLNIPSNLYEAALVDGANAWSQFWRVTIPLLGHTLLLVSILIVFQGLQVFTQVMVLPPDAGGPGNATYVINLFVWERAFQELNFSVATAAAFVLFVIIFVITLVQIRLLRPTWSY